MKNKNLLILSAGRRVELLSEFKREVNSRGLQAFVFATDLVPNMSAACQFADGSFTLPHVSKNEYISQLLSLCIKHSIGMVIPTIDNELLCLAHAREIFAKEGIHLVVSDETLIRACRDKRNTSELFESIGINTPKILDRECLSFPCFAKPYDGSRSVGAVKLNNIADFTEVMQKNPKLMFMEYIDDSYNEYTVDAYFDIKGNLKCMVPRHRLEVRSGEVSKAVTHKNHVYDYLLNRISRIKGARGCLTLQLFAEPSDQKYFAIEINPRFGGGYPLSYNAGANYPGWLIDEYLLNKNISFFDDWKSDLLMLRFDTQVLLQHAH
jgi:carbamoyl-phosphate synthase large subunit